MTLHESEVNPSWLDADPEETRMEEREAEATYRATIRACELVGEGYTSSLARQVARECRDAVDAAWSQRALPIERGASSAEKEAEEWRKWVGTIGGGPEESGGTRCREQQKRGDSDIRGSLPSPGPAAPAARVSNEKCAEIVKKIRSFVGHEADRRKVTDNDVLDLINDLLGERAALAAAEKETNEQARLNGMGMEREARLIAERDEARRALVATESERDAAMSALADKCEAHYVEIEAERDEARAAVARLRTDMLAMDVETRAHFGLNDAIAATASIQPPDHVTDAGKGRLPLTYNSLWTRPARQSHGAGSEPDDPTP